MRVALVAMQDCQMDVGREARNASGRSEAGRFGAVELEQALALAIHMREGSRLAPLLICRKNSLLEKEARNQELPFLALGGSPGLYGLFKLWRWQRRNPYLLVLVIGESGLRLGRKLYKMRKANSGELDLMFFLRPPGKERCKELIQASLCLCGSSHVAECLEGNIQEFLARGKSLQRPELLQCQPGINLEKFDFPRPEYSLDRDMRAGKHFVFGMAESLMPASGALLVARAMAALWQRDDLPPWELRMFGSGPRYGEILAEAMKLGVASRLSLLSEQHLHEVTRHCHAWLAPGISPDELPETLWAGFAAGLPVICVQSGLHRERVSLDGNRNAAIRVGDSDPQKMAKAMIGMMRNARLRRRMGLLSMAMRPQTGLGAMAARTCRILESRLPENETDK